MPDFRLIKQKAKMIIMACACCIACRAFGQCGEIPTNKLNGRWKFDETGGTTAKDVVGSLNLSLQKGASWDPSGGKNGGAVRLIRSKNQWLKASQGLLNKAFTARTWAVWIKPVGTKSTQLVVDEGGDRHGGGMRINNNRLEGRVINSYKGFDVSCAFTAANAWSHIAMTWNGSKIVLFRNGKPEATGTTTFTNVPDHKNVSGLGWSDEHAWGKDKNNAYDGLLDDLLVYSMALREADIKNIACQSATEIIAEYDTRRFMARPVTIHGRSVPTLGFDLVGRAAGADIGFGAMRALTASSGRNPTIVRAGTLQTTSNLSIVKEYRYLRDSRE